MALRQPDRLESNNPKAYGIVKATEISGHRTVTSFMKLCNIPDCILSESGNNTNSDAIGQVWYVISDNCRYILVDWENRRNIHGWEKFSSVESGIEAGERIQFTKNPYTGATIISAESEINDELDDSSSMSWSINKLRSVITGKGLKLVTREDELKLDVNVDDKSIEVSQNNVIQVKTVDGGTFI